MMPPCKDCAERSMYCHGNCEKYSIYAAAMEEARKKRNLDSEAFTAAYLGRIRIKKARMKK